MTAKLFNDQLVLEVPKGTKYVCFRCMPEIIDFCLRFPFERKKVLTDIGAKYVTLSMYDVGQWYTTMLLEDGDNHYDATDALLQLIQQSQAYEYW